jgi:hypothetical protein
VVVQGIVKTKRVRLEGGPGDGATVDVNAEVEWLQYEVAAAPRKSVRSILSRPTAPPAFHRYRRDPARPDVYIHVGNSRHSTR